MAFWNAPLDQPDHALRACRAAVKMLEKLEELKASWRAEGYPELEIGIGINSGPMVVGNMGSDVRVDYTVLGDAVNLGSRLEGTNKEYETRIIISECTWAMAKDEVVGPAPGRGAGEGQAAAGGHLRAARRSARPRATRPTAIAAFEAGARGLRRAAAGTRPTRLFKVVLRALARRLPGRQLPGGDRRSCKSTAAARLGRCRTPARRSEPPYRLLPRCTPN